MIFKKYITRRNGKDIYIFTLRNKNDSSVKITNYGGVIMSINVPDKYGNIDDVVLGFNTVERYMQKNPYFGATIGRYANRISKGKFILNRQEYTLACNENSHSHLHGGNEGFDKKIWNAEICGDSIELNYISPDMEEGYPSELFVKINFSWSDDNELVIKYFAKSDGDTILNLTNHSYFNLNGGTRDILNHQLFLNAKYYTPIDIDLIPTGQIKSVKNTAFDFTDARAIGKRINDSDPQLVIGKGYDHNFIVEGIGLRLFAKVFEEETGRLLEVYSDQPAVQFFSGNFMKEMKAKKDYNLRYGFCLETQNYPDAINNKNFPNCILKKEKSYNSITKYCFKVINNQITD